MHIAHPRILISTYPYMHYVFWYPYPRTLRYTYPNIYFKSWYPYPRTLQDLLIQIFILNPGIHISKNPEIYLSKYLFLILVSISKNPARSTYPNIYFESWYPYPRTLQDLLIQIFILNPGIHLSRGRDGHRYCKRT